MYYYKPSILVIISFPMGLIWVKGNTGEKWFSEVGIVFPIAIFVWVTLGERLGWERGGGERKLWQSLLLECEPCQKLQS